MPTPISMICYEANYVRPTGEEIANRICDPITEDASFKTSYYVTSIIESALKRTYQSMGVTLKSLRHYRAILEGKTLTELKPEEPKEVHSPFYNKWM